MAADRLRRLLVNEPAALFVYLRHPVTSRQAIRRVDMVLNVLREAGFDEAVAHAACAAIQTYTIGFAALEASRAGWVPDETAGPVAIELASFTSNAQFFGGLRFLLEGATKTQVGELGM
jgi:hypothetical protein